MLCSADTRGGPNFETVFWRPVERRMDDEAQEIDGPGPRLDRGLKADNFAREHAGRVADLSYVSPIGCPALPP
jgi:hypothetical protein